MFIAFVLFYLKPNQILHFPLEKLPQFPVEFVLAPDRKTLQFGKQFCNRDNRCLSGKFRLLNDKLDEFAEIAGALFEEFLRDDVRWSVLEGEALDWGQGDFGRGEAFVGGLVELEFGLEEAAVFLVRIVFSHWRVR